MAGDDTRKPPRDCTKILTWLKTKKYRDVKDLRKKARGALWVITANDPPTQTERDFFEKEVNAKGYDFRFTAVGSKATGKRPAWYWQPED